MDQQIELDDISGLLSYAELLLGVDRAVEEEFKGILEHAFFKLGEPAPDPLETTTQAERAIRIARAEIQKRLGDLKQREDFVPAAGWSSEFRGVLFEHLRVEMDVLLGAIRVEPLWMALGELQITEPVLRLCLAGGRTVHRAVGEFLVGSSGSYKDQAAARDFFPGNEWEKVRTENLAKSVLHSMRLTNKQVSHLTSTRPLPEDFYVYAPRSLGPEAEELLELLREFSSAAPSSLLPDWWSEWLPQPGTDLHREPS